MKRKFNLSNHICNVYDDIEVITLIRVKEFIKRLKETIHIEEFSELMDKRLTDAIENQIDKLAGSKLI